VDFTQACGRNAGIGQGRVLGVVLASLEVSLDMGW
jgi:hypothetical protein